MLKSGQVWTGNFISLDSDGSLIAPGVGPAGTLYVGGDPTASVVTITGTNPYKFSVTLPALTAGQSVGMYVTATIGGIATAGLAEDMADTEFVSDLNDITAANVWAYATRTLTSSAAATTAAVSGSTLAITARATYSATLTGLTINAAWEKIWLTFKRGAGDTDARSIMQILVSNPGVGTDGLLYLNGAAGVAAQAALVVNQAAGTIAITITDDATSNLTPRRMSWDAKQLVAAATTQLTAGAASVDYAITAALA